MKTTKRYVSVILLIVMTLLVCTTSVSAATLSTNSAKTEEIPYESYTYWQDYGSSKKTAVYCKPMYGINRVISGNDLGIGLMESVSDIYTSDIYIYILDGESGRIVILNQDYTLNRQINELFYNGEKLNIKGASGIFAKDGRIYIADSKNSRVLIADENGNVIKILTAPVSRLIPDNFNYIPIKIAVDSNNYTYIVSDGSYYGALVYSDKMEFIGFYGANTVKSTPMDIIRKLADRFFSNDVKKGSSVLALPYQFNDLVVGPSDFIYTTTGNTGEVSASGQVCMMNPGGINVLGTENFNFIDNNVGIYANQRQVQSITGIEVDKDGFFYLIDSTYGRIFWYDKECNLMCVFGGGIGNRVQKGTFQYAGCISLCGTDVLVGDKLKKTVTVFSLTEYGKLIRSTQLKTINDDFENSVSEWKEVLKQDQNSQLAYRGLANAYYMQKDNRLAAEYAKLGADREIYSNAFSKLRKTMLEKNFLWIFIIVIMLIIALVIFAVYCKKKKWKLVKNEKLRIAFYNVFHPFDGAGLVKEKKKGSVRIAVVLLAIYYILSAVADTASGFAFNYFDASEYNSLFILFRTVGLVLLWSVSNWLVCVLLGGIGKWKEIFTITCYCLIPLIFSTALSLILSHMLVPDEFVFVGIIQTFCILYSFFMLMAGISKIHDFEFSKFFGTTLLTIISMLIIIFLIFLIFLLAQQVYGWFCTIYVEWVYR